jgi:hypothetical protein
VTDRGPAERLVVDQHGHVHDLTALNRQLLDPADPDTLRRLLDGLRTLNPGHWPATEETET